MSRPTVINHDVLSGEIIEREMDDAEFAEWQAQIAQGEITKAEQAAKSEARQAVLDKLNLTADEVAALLS